MPLTTDVRDAQIGIFPLKTGGKEYMQYVIDLSAFRDPQGQPQFRDLDGRSPAVQNWIKSDPRLPALLDGVTLQVRDALDNRHQVYTSIGLKDHHGKWISVAVATLLADHLSDRGYRVFFSAFHIWGK